MEISWRVVAAELEEVNLGTIAEPRTISIAKNLPPSTIMELIALLGEYKDVFAWSYDNMKGLDPKFYRHQINLATDAKLVQQRRYRMNPNYATRVKEEIDKLLKIGFIRIVCWMSTQGMKCTVFWTGSVGITKSACIRTSKRKQHS